MLLHCFDRLVFEVLFADDSEGFYSELEMPFLISEV